MKELELYREGIQKLTSIPLVKEVRFYESAASTNDCAKADIRAGKTAGGSLYVADMQTAGKGRTGRSFSSPSGTGIYMSLTVREELLPEAFPLLTIVAAVAVSNALDKICEVVSHIKWPNDILIAGENGELKKTVGILTEAVGDTAVIGIGINVNNKSFPAELIHAGSLYTVTGREYERRGIVEGVMKELDAMVPELVKNGNLSFLKSEYDTKLVSLNREVSVIPLEETLKSKDTGGLDAGDCFMCLGIDDYGALVLEDRDGSVTRVNSGEVSLRGLKGYV